MSGRRTPFGDLYIQISLTVSPTAQTPPISRCDPKHIVCVFYKKNVLNAFSQSTAPPPSRCLSSLKSTGHYNLLFGSSQSSLIRNGPPPRTYNPHGVRVVSREFQHQKSGFAQPRGGVASGQHIDGRASDPPPTHSHIFHRVNIKILNVNKMVDNKIIKRFQSFFKRKKQYFYGQNWFEKNCVLNYLSSFAPET